MAVPRGKRSKINKIRYSIPKVARVHTRLRRKGGQCTERVTLHPLSWGERGMDSNASALEGVSALDVESQKLGSPAIGFLFFRSRCSLLLGSGHHIISFLSLPPAPKPTSTDICFA